MTDTDDTRPHSDGPGEPIHNVSRRWTGPPIDPEHGVNYGIDVRILDFATAFGDWDAIPVIGADGEVSVTLMQRAIYPNGTGLWGCAICEQWHPTGVKTCPLVGKTTERVAVGPLYHDGDEVSYLVATCAVGTFVHGQMDSGVAVWRTR